MPLSKNVSQYQDIRQVLDAMMRQALPGTITFPTSGKATYWRQRANYFRSLLHQQQRDQLEHLPGAVTETPYDKLVFRQNGPQIIIAEYVGVEDATLLDADGNPIDLTPPEPADETQAEASSDDLMSAALDLVRDKGEEDDS